MSPFAAKACLPRLLKEVVADHPNLKINISVRMASALLPMLIGEEIDFLICTQNQIPPSAPVRSIALGSCSTSLLVRAGHPLLSDRDLDPRDFPIVSSGPFGPSGELSAQLGPRATPTPQVIVESSEGLSELTQGTNAIWITSPMAALDMVATGKLVELPVPASQTRQQFQVLMYCLDRRSAAPMMLNIEARIRRIIEGALPLKA
jgi:DNA-binding transcriptional LysR family regulator